MLVLVEHRPMKWCVAAVVDGKRCRALDQQFDTFWVAVGLSSPSADGDGFSLHSAFRVGRALGGLGLLGSDKGMRTSSRTQRSQRHTPMSTTGELA
jgi:hypothetical protein